MPPQWDEQLCLDNFATAAIDTANEATPECDWAQIDECLVCGTGGPILVLCAVEGCVCCLHHMCQAEWDSKDVRREAHGSRKMCVYHHPALADMPVQLPPRALNPSNQEFSKDEAEIKWLLDMNKSIWQVYQQTITPMADGSFSLPLITAHKDFVFDLALLLSMATGALTDDQLQTKHIDELSQKGWLKNTSINVSKIMYQKEIMHLWEIRSMDNSATTDEDSLLRDGKNMG
jgi:hypothetical protein